jgi:hypothetical protein
MASLIAILDVKGKTLIQRCYRDDLGEDGTLTYLERFMPLILDMEEEGQPVPPCFSSQGINYMHIRHSNLYRASRPFNYSFGVSSRLVLALSRRNSNAAEIIIFLHSFVQVLIGYFKTLEEESIRDNFVIIYELMDEMLDFGYPQTTEIKMLLECVQCSNGFTYIYIFKLQIHHARIEPTQSADPPAKGNNECGFVAARGDTIQEERGVFGRCRKRQHPRERERRRSTL